MMESIFLYLLNTSLSASWLILVVIILRRILTKTPKWIICLLWAVIAFRLVCPISVGFPVAVIPHSNITPEIVNASIPGISIPQFDATPIVQDTGLIHVMPSVKEIRPTNIAAIIWFVGMCCMIVYLMVSYFRLHHQVREAAHFSNNIWLCDFVQSPFILGILKPKIYLPSSISERDMEYVVAHEKAHLKRKDHCWKLLGYLFLAVFWFHPLMWISFVLMCRDIEFACDEKVIQGYGLSEKKAYSEALIECSSVRKLVIACPIAFGETAVIERIRNVMNYRKPRFWIVLISIIVLVLIAMCSLFVQAEGAVQSQGIPDSESIRPSETVSDDSEAKEWSNYPDGVRTETVKKENLTGYVMIVRDPSKVYLAASSEKFSKQIPGAYIGDIVEREQAIAAVNASLYFDDGSSSSEVGSIPLGMVIRKGEIIWDNPSNNSPFSSFVGFNRDNILIVASSIDSKQADELNIRDGCVSGPLLIVNSQPNDAVCNGNYGYDRRTAIGQRFDGAVIFVCTEGRTADSIGATYQDVIDILMEYGAVNACALSGSNATTMLFRNHDSGMMETMTKLPVKQSEESRMPTFWMVQPAE